ncbi:MAG: DUF3794 and LysM peptidoglycan-binding domain-containing protein [Eubacteriales bacterium]|jgi:hypothetical protein
MELELRKESYVFYDTGLDMTGTREEMYDAIVPDALPDILRIVESHGVAMINTREMRESRLIVTGTVRASVIYVPESGEGLEHLTLSIPFTHEFEMNPESRGVLLCSVELQSIDSRTINPRKVLVRTTVRIDARSIDQRSFSLCTDVNAVGREDVQLLKQSYLVRMPCAAKTKSFAISDELEMSSSNPPAAEILKWSCKTTSGEYNIVGRKVIFKATLSIKLLCKGRGPGNDVFTSQIELPFSQIIEADGLTEGAQCFIWLQPENVSVELNGESGGRILSVSADIEAQLSAYAPKRLETIADLYSTSMRSVVDSRPYEFTELVDLETKRQTIRDTVETDTPVRYVLDMEVLFEEPTVSREQGFIRAETTADVRILYVAEDGGIYHASRRLPVSVRSEAPDGSGCRVRVTSASEAFSAAAISGAEVRFDACFDLEATRRRNIFAVHSARLEPYGEDAPLRPSVVLKYPQRGESLWSMAKRYNSAEADIRAANDLEPGDEPNPDELLLIPKRR